MYASENQKHFYANGIELQSGIKLFQASRVPKIKVTFIHSWGQHTPVAYDACQNTRTDRYVSIHTGSGLTVLCSGKLTPIDLFGYATVLFPVSTCVNSPKKATILSHLLLGFGISQPLYLDYCFCLYRETEIARVK